MRNSLLSLPVSLWIKLWVGRGIVSQKKEQICPFYERWDRGLSQLELLVLIFFFAM